VNEWGKQRLDTATTNGSRAIESTAHNGQKGGLWEPNPVRSKWRLGELGKGKRESTKENRKGVKCAKRSDSGAGKKTPNNVKVRDNLGFWTEEVVLKHWKGRLRKRLGGEKTLQENGDIRTPWFAREKKKFAP